MKILEDEICARTITNLANKILLVTSDTLREHGANNPDNPVIIACAFEAALVQISKLYLETPLVVVEMLKKAVRYDDRQAH